MDKMTLNQIRAAGILVLSQSLGPVGMVRFLQQYEAGMGDYTKERGQQLSKKSAVGKALGKEIT